jgi:hypothetical protein
MNKLYLPNVTLVFVEGRKYSLSKRALDHCINLVDFGDYKIFTPEDVNDPFAIKIDPLPSVQHHSNFMFEQIYKYIDTEFFLAAQWDGIIWDPLQWDENYLKYDYIGAPWPLEHEGRNVGNGGFSLRSKRLYEFIAKDASFNKWAYEDVEVCRNERIRLEQEGFTFAPSALAHKFSLESNRTLFDVPTYRDSVDTAFGLHGHYAFSTFMPQFYRLQIQDLKNIIK